jgi:general secretion pathway protein M
MMKQWFVQQFQQSPSLYAIWLAFCARTQRERLLIMVGLALLLVLGLFYGVWQPAYQAKLDAQQRLTRANGQYQQLLVNAQQIASSRVSEPTFEDRDGTELLQVVNLASSQTQFAADRINFEGQDSLQIWASNVPFARVSAWLNALGEQQVMIDDFQLERVSDGQVNVRITLD